MTIKTISSKKVKQKVPCPTCKAAVAFKSDHFPFCSARCQTADLGNWASDAYAIPDNNPDDVEALISALEAHDDTSQNTH